MADHIRQDERGPDPADDLAPDAAARDAAARDAAARDAAGPDAADPDAAGPDAAPDAGDASDADADAPATPARSRRGRRRGASEDPEVEDPEVGAPEAAGAPAADRTRRTPRASVPLVPVLAVLLVLLLAGTGYLLATRPEGSSVRTDDYVDALQAARAGIVDVASFDYVTIDDDIQQIRAVTTGDLQTESVDQLDGRRQEITAAQAVVNTEVVGAAVGAADADSAVVYMVIQSTQSSSASEQTQVQRYRIQVDMTKDGDRWLLSGITGR